MAQQLTHLIKGKHFQFRLYARRFLANRLGRSTHSVSLWQTQMFVPKPLISLSQRSAWYTFDELKIYERAFCSDHLRRGVSISGSLFSTTVLAEVATLRENVERSGPTVLSPGLDIQEVVDELNVILEHSNWRRKPDLSKRRVRKELRLFVPMKEK